MKTLFNVFGKYADNFRVVYLEDCVLFEIDNSQISTFHGSEEVNPVLVAMKDEAIGTGAQVFTVKGEKAKTYYKAPGDNITPAVMGVIFSQKDNFVLHLLEHCNLHQIVTSDWDIPNRNYTAGLKRVTGDWEAIKQLDPTTLVWDKYFVNLRNSEEYTQHTEESLSDLLVAELDELIENIEASGDSVTVQEPQDEADKINAILAYIQGV